MVSRCVSLLVIICCMLCICLGLNAVAPASDDKASVKPPSATKKDSPEQPLSSHALLGGNKPLKQPPPDKKQPPPSPPTPNPPPSSQSFVPGLSYFDFLQVPTESKPLTLDLSGSQNAWFYGYYGQLGSRGFFGDYDVDASSTGGLFASLNGWVGNPQQQVQVPNPSIPTTTAGPATTPDIANALVSGTSAATSQFVLNVDPKYGNDWVTLRARYTINAYSTASTQGSTTVISPGQLTMWDVRVSTPIADITAGKVLFHKGCSLEFSRNRTTEYLMLERDFCVPDILGCLVASGALPRGVMSWFNPQFWPRYKQSQQPKVTPPPGQTWKNTYSPEYYFFWRGKRNREEHFSEEGRRSRKRCSV